MGERLIASEVHGQADAYLAQLQRLYRGRPDLAEPLARFETQASDALNDGERLRLFGRTVLAPLDRQARRLVTRGARDIGALTALSPLGLLDSAIVLWRTLAMLRAIARLYGVRPGPAASIRLLRRTLAHVLAAGVGELLSDAALETAGASLLSVISTRIGQGAVHGLLAARLGLAAVQICRPLPFVEGELPSMKQLRADLFD
jgi:putative membrane protein